MELQHSFTVPVDIATAWALFNDIEQVAPCLPGAQITSVEADSFSGTAKIKLGPVSLTYAGTGRFVERDEAAHRAVIEALGKDKRGNGTAAATVTAHLEPAGDGTKVVMDTDLKITGRPAQFGRGMIQDVGGRILDQFAACLASRLEAPADEPVAGSAAGSAPRSVEESAAADEPAPRDVSAGESAAGEPAAESPPMRLSPVDQSAPRELDLGSVLVPPDVKRWAPIVVAVLVTAVVTRWLSRRRD